MGVIGRRFTALCAAAVLSIWALVSAQHVVHANQVADDAPANAGPRAGAIRGSIALLGIEALGIESELVARLEALFRMEIERLAGKPLLTRRQIAQKLRRSRSLRNCSGNDRCLTAIGKKLGVDLIVTGNVAALGDSYVLNIKAVDVATGKQLPKRIATKPLRGSPDELIEAVRVAAYELLAPAELHGSLMILSDLVGAEVELDGRPVGKTPLPAPLRNLTLGEHIVVVKSKGYLPFDEKVRVRFQKSTRVIVRLAKREKPSVPLAPIPTVIRQRPARKSWYTSTWFIVGAGVTAAVVGGVIGYQFGHDTILDCGARPGLCVR